MFEWCVVQDVSQEVNSSELMRRCQFSANRFFLSVAILLMISCAIFAHTTTSPDRIRSYRLKRSFYDDDCKGIYDRSIYAKVYQVCEDCYNIMREQKLHTSCRSNCFSSMYYKECIDMLQMKDEMPQFEEWIKKLRGLGLK